MNEEATDPIRNRDRIGGMRGKNLALECVAAGIRAADPATAIRESISLDGTTLGVDGESYDLDAFDRVVVLGGGNAAGHAAAAVEDVLGEWIDGGVVLTDNPVETDAIRMLPGDHPIPSERGVENTREVLSLADEVDAGDLVVTLVTGGGSALLAAPADVSLEDLQATTDALLASGATIHEINAVRKHLSRIKGGQLARRLAPATVVGLLCSDVVGEDPSVIASGPLAPDDSTFDDALAVLETYSVDVPTAVTNRLEAGASGDRTETPDEGDDAFQRVHQSIVVDNATATAAAAAVAREAGFTPHVLGSRLRGRAREVGKVLVGIAEAVSATGTPVEPPAVLLSGGETTVEISGEGTGGPNQELAVSAALELEDARVTLAAVDTDGIDGNSSAAGGLVTHETVDDRQRALDAIRTNDTGPYLETVGGAIRTGPTSTNVNDLHVVVVESDSTLTDDRR